MRLNHLDLQVHDVHATTLLFERHFGFTLTSSRTSPAIAILAGEGDFILVLQRRKDDLPYPEGFHCGFRLERPELVVAFQARAEAEGLAISPVLTNQRGTIVYLEHDGILIEVNAPLR